MAFKIGDKVLWIYKHYPEKGKLKTDIVYTVRSVNSNNTIYINCPSDVGITTTYYLPYYETEFVKLPLSKIEKLIYNID